MSFQESMESSSPPVAGQPVRGSAVQRFGAGLTEPQVRRFQAILREECGVEVPLPEAWSRAIELLTLVELLLESRGIIASRAENQTEFALPRS